MSKEGQKVELVPEVKEDGSLKLASKRFGVSLTLGKAGTFIDEQTHETKSYDDFIKISTGTFALKLNPLALVWLRAALDSPEIVAELRQRADAERKALIDAANTLVF